MAAISSISIVIGAITTGFTAAMSIASAAVTGFIVGLSQLSMALVKVATSIVGSLISAIGKLISSILRVTAVTAVFIKTTLVGLAAKAVHAAAGLETLQTQFVSLLGSAEEAQKRMIELAEFSKTTPFQLKEIAQASRVLQSLTKGVLATGEGLRMVGDAAAQANQPIQEIAVHIGRLFQGAMSGRPAGEALARLQELGMISGETRTKFEMLQKAGMKGKDVWGVVAKELSNANGAMDNLSKTTAGLWSTLKDNLNIAFAELGKILQPIVNFALKKAINMFSNLGDLIRENRDTIRDFITNGLKMMGKVLITTFNVGKKIFTNLGTVIDTFTLGAKRRFASLVVTLKELQFKAGVAFLDLRKKYLALGGIVAKGHDAIKKDLFNQVWTAAQAYNKLQDKHLDSQKKMQKVIADGFKDSEKGIKEFNKMINNAMKPDPSGDGFFERFRKTMVKLIQGAKDFGKFANMGAEELEKKLDSIKKTAKEIGQPTLALKGSQEAARGEAGLLGQEKMIKLNEKQVRLLEEIRNQNRAMNRPVAEFGFAGG